jgi:hypothetical protein
MASFWGSNMTTYKTKYFGKINFHDYVSATVIYDNHEIFIGLDNCIYNGKKEIWLDIINKYVVFYNASKNAILNNYSKNKTIKKYFKDCFVKFGEKLQKNIFGTNKYEMIDIKSVIDKLEYPNLHIESKNNEIIISLNYHLSEKCVFGASNGLSVYMDIDFNICGFDHFVNLIC